jgi:two-component system phosphate regulon sensor histidine kinase PhoR
MTAKIFLKLIAAVFCFLIISLIAVDFMASRVAEDTYVSTLKRELSDKVRMLAEEPQELRNPDRLRALARASGGRITLVENTGAVLADSENDPAQMENHRDRPEIVAALAGRVGSDRRRSGTMGVQFLYLAGPLEGGAIRIAVPLREIEVQVNAIRRQMLAATTLAFLPAVVLAAFFARYFSSKLGSIIEYAAQLSQGNFSARLQDPGSDELGILSGKLNDTGAKLQLMFEQLQHEQVELEKLERIRKDFVINVSHELRTPLASIQGYTETLLDGALHDAQNNMKFLRIIHQNAERLARLTADLLTLSRLELKSQKLQFDSYYINPLLENSRDSMQPLADKKDIKLDLELAPPATEVFCDSEALHQMLMNLVDNAVKYTPEGGRVMMGARPCPQNSQMVEIYVRDTGMGIPPEDLPRLFERFYRVDKARSREMGGTGLGLAIVKHLAKAQGGEVNVESRINEGSTFSFVLPSLDLGLQEHDGSQQELTGSSSN